MATELIPVVDLRVLSQSELATLALSSPNAFDLRRCDDVVVPKIDRAVFNESAGSRKQTYSRLRLAPPKPDSSSPSLPRRRGRPRSIPLRTTAAASVSSSFSPSDQPKNDPDHRENLLIASFLRQLFSREEPASQTLAPDKAVSPVSANETNEGWRNILAAAEEAQKALVLAEDVDRESLTPKGVAVDLVLLGQLEEPFGEEMRRRTHGLTTEGQLLGFLSGLDGQWGSRRKRRKFVDASVFGDVLPRGWKLLLGLKRKEGVAWLDCRRYVSPKGYQFVSCKEVSSYISSLQGSQQLDSDREDDNTHSPDKVTNGSNVGQVHQSIISNRSSSFSSATPISNLSGNHEKQTDVTTCYYATPISYISCENEKQQLFSSPQRRAKRRRRGKMIVDGVILKDGKFECQFCHKTFTERHRYTGHIGAHVRYQGLTAETLLDETSATKSTDQSSWAIVPYTSENDVAAMKNDDCQTIQCVIVEHGASTTGGHEISIANSCDGFHTEGIVDEGIATGIKCNDCIDSKFPSVCDINTTSQKYSPMITMEASACEPVDSDFKDRDMTSSNTKGVNDAKIFEEVKHSTFSNSVPLFSTHSNKDIPKAPDVSAFSSSISNSVSLLPESTHVENALCEMNDETDDPSSSMSKPKDANSPFLTYLHAAGCHANQIVRSMSRNKPVDGTYLDAACVDNIASETITENSLPSSPNKSGVCNKSDGNSIKHNYQNVDDASKYMDVDTNLCYDLSLSLMDMDVKTNDKHSEINRPSSRLNSEFEVYNEKFTVEVQNHLLTFSGNQSGITFETYGKDISTHAVDRHVEKPISINGQDDNECCHSFSDKDAILVRSMHDTLQASSIVAPFSGEQAMDIEANTDCSFHTDINESVFEETDKPVNELELFFSGTNTVHEGNAADEMIGNDDASKTVHINLASSWIQGTNVLPVLDMLPDQCGIELNEISQKNDNLQGFEELRLGAIEPSDFVLFTGHEPRSVVETSMAMGYVSELDDHHCSSLHLGWNISLSNMENMSSLTCVCVWCSTEFRHEQSAELHSETLGYICSACKAKFSGR